MTSLFLWLLALFSAGLTWRQLTSVANRHRHLLSYSCGHLAQRPRFGLPRVTGQDPSVLASPGVAGHGPDGIVWHHIASRFGAGLASRSAMESAGQLASRFKIAVAQNTVPVPAATVAFSAGFGAPVFSIWTFTLLSGGSLGGGSFGLPYCISDLRAGIAGQLIIDSTRAKIMVTKIVLISYIDCTGSVMIQSYWTPYRTPIVNEGE